ncbi:hypothetical protein HCN44_009170 [Aphidius gifuensis]|uniref:Major facilitator superfamily (MFS) profile domain-containing protein n=1 Tax=Aphidius gifuensis TaxID=684658 RepID=A0A835CVS9_APHGI|nr:synaptic vesicle glycoprotein 2B-like [Aphidius gifuensis]XP_044015994.1 synaptic vesicle glycoprotein 2B-like [Aphidius gifuensis]KAF7997772.1 hypothetical protein HCN44_009170 [Aphidius gifuensis]
MNKNVVLKSVRVIDIENYEPKTETPADYETAIAATGFGLFNILVVLAAMPIAWAGAFNMSTSAFILASSECDLELTFLRKGILNSMVYFGMIMSPFFWSFIMERMNRKAILMIGLLMDAMCNILCSIIDSYYIFLLFKFISGTIVSGPYTLLVPYINEFHSVNYRAKFTTCSGLVFGIGFIIPAALAVIVTPQNWTIEIFNYVFLSWRIYLMICTLPSIIGILTMSLLPESPKRLIEDGNTSSAHDLLKRIYQINNWESKHMYPINKLKEDYFEDKKAPSFIPEISQSWNNLKSLFSKPHLGIFLLINILHFGSMLAFNTMRLWVPQIYQIISNFDSSTWEWSKGWPTTCDYLAMAIIPNKSNSTIYSNPNCVQWKINPSVYVNSTLIASSAIGFSFLFALFYTTRQRKRGVMFFCFVIGILCGFGTNWGGYVPWMLTQAAIVVVTGRTTANIIMSVNNNIIPQNLRTTATTFVTNIGSFGSIIGNLGFSWLLDFSCLTGFLSIAIILSVCLLLSVFILQPEKNKIKNKKQSSTVP